MRVKNFHVIIRSWDIKCESTPSVPYGRVSGCFDFMHTHPKIEQFFYLLEGYK